MSKLNKQYLVDFLRESGVCQTCVLRYLKARGPEYANPQKTFENLGLHYEKPESEEENEKSEPATKKPRPNTCPLCFGLFSPEFLQLFVERVQATNIDDYDCKSIVLAISTPIIMHIRQLSMWYALIDQFGPLISAKECPDISVKEAAKLLLNPLLCSKLKKGFDIMGIMITVTIRHKQEEAEILILEKVNNVIFKAKGKPKGISRALLENHYTPFRVSESIYKKFVPVPPPIPSDTVFLDTLQLTGPAAIIAGRYRKFDRALSHTPWILDGKRILQESVEEIIIKQVAPFFCTDIKRSIFMSSGREDVDVRCLGKGRPFCIEFPNSIRTKLSKEQARKMEEQIDQTGKVSVRNLQLVKREELSHIKDGEENKRKGYRALCKLSEPVTLQIIEKLNCPSGFEIRQRTPIRVLHRRPLLTRSRWIYNMEALAVRGHPNTIVLNFVTQAGTYIKELVHGDFGRTRPSLTEMIGKPIDIIALDVTAIDLDWPKFIDNSEPV